MQHKTTKTLAAAVLALMLSTSAYAFEKPVFLQDQGSFFAGGTTVTTPGSFDFSNPLNPQGQTLHGDHAYVFYQKPVNAHKLPLVFLHGAGQSKKTWETTPDGRDGFQNIFLERGYATYLVDQPRRGDAGQATVDGTVSATTNDQFWFSNFRVGDAPEFFKGVQFSKDPAALDQYYRQMTPNTAPYDQSVVVNALSAVFDKTGDGVLITHSQGGGPGWRIAIKNPKVRAVISYEPGSSFVFPQGEEPEAIPTSSPFGPLHPETVTLDEFMQLTKIPIVIYYGDNIAENYTDEWNKDSWRIRLDMAHKFATAVNRHGGDCTVVHLPEIGVTGNTHFPFSDLNNVQIADLMQNWLHEKGLDK